MISVHQMVARRQNDALGVQFPGGIAVPERRKLAVSRHSRRQVLDKRAPNASEEAN